jgi:hypothetical protein
MRRVLLVAVLVVAMLIFLAIVSSVTVYVVSGQ